jgi:peptide/nickel transport system substrate-binding protein
MNRFSIRRTVALTATGVMLAAGLVGVTAPAQAASSTLTIGYDSDPVPSGYDPALYAAGQRFFMESLYDSLFYKTAKGGVTPGIALSSSQNSDNTTLTMVIRQGQSFSDGTPVTTEAVKANLDRVFTDKKTNYTALQQFVSGGTSEIKSVTTSGDNVTVTFAKPQANAAALFTGESGMMVSGAQATITNGLGTVPDGSGPYRLVKAGSIKGNTYKMVKNTKYWNAKNYQYSKLTYKIISNAQARANALATGQVDIATGVDGSTVKFLQSRKAGLVTLGGHIYMLVFWNGGQNPPGPKPLVGDKNVRLALSYATDRAAIVKSLYKGDRATANYIPKGEPGFDPSLDSAYAYNPTKAKQLLAAAAVSGLTLETLYGDPSQAAFFTALTAQWAKVGVTLKARLAANTGELFGAVGSEAFGIFDATIDQPAGFAAGVLVNGFGNFMHTKNPAVEGSLGAAFGNPGPTSLKALNNALVNEAWIMPYREGQSYTGYNKKTVKAPKPGVDGPNPMLIGIRKK